MSVLGDTYRALAKEQGEASAAIIGKADPTSETVKLDLAMMSHVKATIYSCVADVADELDQLKNATPREARAELHQRMRLAAIRNDHEAMDRIIAEEAERLKDGQ